MTLLGHRERRTMTTAAKRIHSRIIVIKMYLIHNEPSRKHIEVRILYVVADVFVNLNVRGTLDTTMHCVACQLNTVKGQVDICGR